MKTRKMGKVYAWFIELWTKFFNKGRNVGSFLVQVGPGKSAFNDPQGSY